MNKNVISPKKVSMLNLNAQLMEVEVMINLSSIIFSFPDCKHLLKVKKEGSMGWLISGYSRFQKIFPQILINKLGWPVSRPECHTRTL